MELTRNPQLTRTILRFFALALVAWVGVGCAQTYAFKVDAMSHPDVTATGQSYVLVSGDPQVRESDLQFREVAGYLRSALSGEGLYEAPSPAEADLIIEVAFGMGPPTTSYRTVTEPIVAEVGGGVRYHLRTVRNPDGSTSVVTVPVIMPRRTQIIGHMDRQVVETTHEKYLRITASDRSQPGADEQPTQVWSVYVRNQDTSDDLRKYLPFMAAAAMPHFGKQTEGQREIVLKEEDPAVAFVKKPL